MTAEKEKSNDDYFATIRINGCWRRYVWVTSVRYRWRRRPTSKKYQGRQHHAVTKKPILGVRFFGDWNWNLFQAIVYERTESTLENVGTLPMKIFDFEVSLNSSLLNHQTTKFKFLYFDWKCSVFAKSKLGKLRFELEPNQCS